jgi:hypothetical protein
VTCSFSAFFEGLMGLEKERKGGKRANRTPVSEYPWQTAYQISPGQGQGVDLNLLEGESRNLLKVSKFPSQG